MSRPIVLLAACAAVAGCAPQDMLLSAHEKFTQAFPPPAEARIAEEEVRRLLAGAELEAFEKQYEAMTSRRAAQCGAGMDIGRLESVATVKARPVDRQCLTGEDRKLLTFLGMRRVGVLLSQPPLRPLEPLGKIKPITVPFSLVDGIPSAAEAGVVVVRGNRGELLSMAIPGGEQLADLGRLPGDNGPGFMVSPNGRVAAVPLGNRVMRFIDLEAGSLLWEYTDLMRLYAWLPQLGSAIGDSKERGTLTVLDFATGTITPQPWGEGYASWGLALPQPGRFILGTSRGLQVGQLTRGEFQLEARLLDEHPLTRSPSDSNTTLMRGGRALLYGTVRDLMVYDFGTRTETLIALQGVMSTTLAKLGETSILVSATVGGVGHPGNRAWVLDIDQATVAPVEEDARNVSHLQALRGRTGFARRDFEQRLWVGDTLSVGAPVPLSDALAAILIEREEIRQHEIARYALQPAECKVDFADRAAVDRCLAAQAAQAARERQAKARATPQPTLRAGAPMLAATATDPARTMARGASIEVVGVARGRAPSKTDARSVGIVDVIVRRSEKPMLLVLTSAEAVTWRVSLMPGATLSGVLYGGSRIESRVVGISGVRTLPSLRSTCHVQGACAELDAEIVALTGRKPDFFYGQQTGTAVSVGGH